MIVLSTAYLGSVRYYADLLTGEAVIDLYEHYLKQSGRNRCEIAGANGVIPLTVPVVKRHGEKVPVREVRIDYATSWQHRHWRSIVSAYRNSPYFDHYEPFFAPFYTRRCEYLAELNHGLQQAVLQCLKVSPAVAFSDRYLTGLPPGSDRRYVRSPGKRVAETDTDFVLCPYYQTFSDKFPFFPNLSVIDLLFCEGPRAVDYLR